MAFQKFKEYLNDKGDLQKKPIISGDADTGPSGKKSIRPPKAVTKGKHWKNFEAAQITDSGDGSKTVDYSAPGTDPGQLTADGDSGKANPLGNKGEKNLIYNPKTDDLRLKMKKLNKTTPEKAMSPANSKTEEFLNITKELSPEKYAEYILSQNDANSVKKVIEIAELIKNNTNLIETLVREIKRKGNFAELVESILEHPETFGEIAAELANESKGKEIARQLAKAINEITAETTTSDMVPKKDMIPEKKASKTMPPNESVTDSRGKPAKTIKGIPAECDNVRAKKRQYVMMQPEHNLIEALANYKSIKTVMKKLID